MDKSQSKEIIIDGNRIQDISTFYKEINRVFMNNEDWKLGCSLDAFNDMLYGGFGAIKGKESITLIWENFEQNKKDLGKEATLIYYQEKLKSPGVFNTEFIQKKLDELQSGTGQTYIEILLEIISEHSNIKLIVE